MGAGTPGCLETREVGNAPSSKQPGWNKTPKAKNREAGYGNKIKNIALPSLGQSRAAPCRRRTPQWVDGVGVHHCTHQCVPPLKVSVPTHGPVCWSQSQSIDWAQLPTCNWGEHGVGRRYGFTSHATACGIRPKPGHRPWGGTRDTTGRIK